jgi:lysophospholipase L1-like esterase
MLSPITASRRQGASRSKSVNSSSLRQYGSVGRSNCRRRWRFAPDLAVVLAGGNDMLRRRFEPDAAAEPEMYSADQLHLSARGHAVVAAETVRALREVVVAGRIA